MKYLTLITALVAATPAVAETVKAEVSHQYVTVFESVPYTRKECVMVDVPVYGTVEKKGNAAEGAFLGMILGGLAGKGITGDDGGAAAGAVMGGIIGADQASKPKPNTEIIGYRSERQCDQVTYYKDVEREVYDYSIITWKQNGQTYTTTFYK